MLIVNARCRWLWKGLTVQTQWVAASLWGIMLFYLSIIQLTESIQMCFQLHLFIAHQSIITWNGFQIQIIFFLSLSIQQNHLLHIFKTQSHQLIFDNKLGQRWETTGRLRSKIKNRFRIILSAKWYAALNHPDVIRRKYILSSMYDL